MNSPCPLFAGDHLLYGRKPWDAFGFVTSFGTDSPAVHIEVYEGFSMSVASRNGQGVNSYEYRSAQLIAVLRPPNVYDFQKAFDWMNKEARGKPYGWLDLLRWVGPGWLNFKTKGLICSEFADMFDKAAKCGFFNEYFPSESIDPGDFFKVQYLHWEWWDDSVAKFFSIPKCPVQWLNRT